MPETEHEYEVRYYYLATGMEGRADERTEGRVRAKTEREAIDKIIAQNYGHYDEASKQWVSGCLTAQRIR